MKKTRSEYWDWWKGLAIISVVIIHASSGTGGFPTGTFNWYFGLILRQLTNFAVPLFLAYAGYFSARESFEKPIKYYQSRCKRLLYPYLVWTIISISIRNPSHLLSPIELSKDVFLGLGIGVGYFVIVLLQFVIVTPALSKIEKTWHHIGIMITVSVISLMILYWLRIRFPGHKISEFPIVALPFIFWYPFYHLGYFANKFKINKSDFNTRSTRFIIFTIFSLSTIASIIESMLLAHSGLYSFAISQIKISNFLASIALFLFSVLSYGYIEFKSKLVAQLGMNSFPIYLMHLIFLSVANRVLAKYSPIYFYQPLHILLATTLTLVLCVLFIKLLGKAFANSSFKKYIAI